MDNTIAKATKESAIDTPRTSPPRPAKIQRIGPYASCYSGGPGVLNPRIRGSTWTNVKPEIDELPRHELFLLADGERKVEMETVTQVANAALFTFNKEDHTLANMLRDKLYRMEHVTFAAYKVPHPLFATFQLRIHTDGEITPKAAIIKACGELITELQELDQEFTKEFELKKMAANVPNGGLDI
ncbi:hypothetical protein MBLNU13_g06174t1 [Cladosporium sp. NU13]